MAISIGDLWDQYREAVDSGRGRTLGPLAPLVNAWQQRPRPRGNRIVRMTGPHHSRAASRWPTRPTTRSCCSAQPLASSTGQTAINSSLPGFGNAGPHPLPRCRWRCTTWEPVPPSAAANAAPIALRIFVEAVLSVPMHERETRSTRRHVPSSLREFLHWLYPTRFSHPSRVLAQNHESHRGLGQLGGQDSLVRPSDQAQRTAPSCLSGRHTEGDPAHLTKSIRIIVDLPPGSGHGAAGIGQPATLGSTVRAPSYRLLINLAYQWAQTGSHQDSHRQGKGSTLGPGH